MARAELKINLDELEKLIKRIGNQNISTQLSNTVGSEAIIGLVARAIADNFKKEGPGWQPLKAQTIRSSVRGKAAKQVSGFTNEQLLEFEAAAREKNSSLTANRQILRRTSLLMKSATTPGAQGNIKKIDGTNLIWGTNLKYSAIHNYGGVINHPGTTNGFGRVLKIKPHQIKIPQREYLKINDEWKQKLNVKAYEEFLRVIQLIIEGPT